MNERAAELRSYLVGLALAVGLTVPPFILVFTGWLGRAETLGVIVITAVVQIGVHIRFFLHIDLSRQRREDLEVLLFTLMLLLMMGGGTLWILADLAKRMQ